MSYFDQQCLQALQGIERNLDRIATMYEKAEKMKLGVVDPREAFPEYKDIFEAREKEIRETLMPHYELSPKKEPTYGDIFRRFKDKYPSLANHVEDYRPAEEPNSIAIWLDIRNAVDGSSVIIYNDETAEIKADRLKEISYDPDNLCVGIWIKKEPEPEKEIHACETCAYNPPSSLSGCPCALCDTSIPLYDCWRKKETNDD